MTLGEFFSLDIVLEMFFYMIIRYVSFKSLGKLRFIIFLEGAWMGRMEWKGKRVKEKEMWYKVIVAGAHATLCSCQ